LQGKCPPTWDDDVAEASRPRKPEGICRVKASHNLARVSATFDDNGLVSHGGLVVAAALTQKLGVAELVDGHVTATKAGAVNASAKALTVSGSAPAGGDCIDDVAAPPAGATPRLGAGGRRRGARRRARHRRQGRCRERERGGVDGDRLGAGRG